MKPTDLLRTMDEAADEIEVLQQKLEFAEFEWNRAIEGMQERDNRIEALGKHVEQLQDKLHCCYGGSIDHSTDEGHSPVSMYDYALHGADERIEALEAALKFIEALSAEELAYAKIGTGAEVALRHINRRARAALDKERKS